MKNIVYFICILVIFLNNEVLGSAVGVVPENVTVTTEAQTQTPSYSSYPTFPDLPCLGYEFVPHIGHWYKLHTKAAYWTDANKTCVAEGTHLAVIHNDTESEFIIDLFRRNEFNVTGSNFPNAVAIGVYREPSGDWKTVDGQTLEQAGLKWSPLETNTMYRGNRGFLHHRGLISLDDDVFKAAFICEL